MGKSKLHGCKRAAKAKKREVSNANNAVQSPRPQMQCLDLRDSILSVFTVPGGAAPWHGLPLLSHASSSPSPLLLASASSVPALRPITAAQIVAIPAAQHLYQPNLTSTQLLRSHSHSAPSSSSSTASAQTESPQSPPSTPKPPSTPPQASPSTPSPTVLRLHHHLQQLLHRHRSRLQPALCR